MSTDKRKYYRLNAKVEVKVKNISNNAASAKEDIPVVTRDVGVAGVCIVTRKPFRVNDIVQMDISFAQDKVISAIGIVKWVQEQGTVKGLGLNDFFIGVQFTNIADKDRAVIGQFVFDGING